MIARLAPIMYIDDDKDDQELFKHAITALKFPHPVISFWNGKEALLYLKSEAINPFLIICDLNMPIMNGFDLREEINKDEKLKLECIPFIFYSTSAHKTYVDKAYELTVQGYFRKPLDFDEVKVQLKKIIEYWLDCKHPNNC